MLANMPSSSKASGTDSGLSAESVMSIRQRSRESISLASKWRDANLDLPVFAGPINTTKAVSGIEICILPASLARQETFNEFH
jgi:hypothetical protein